MELESRRMTRSQLRRRTDIEGSSSNGNPNKCNKDQPLLPRSQDSICDTENSSTGDLQLVNLSPHPADSAETYNDGVKEVGDKDNQQEANAIEPLFPGPNISSSNQQGASTSSGLPQPMRVIRSTLLNQSQPVRSALPAADCALQLCVANGDQAVVPARIVRCSFRPPRCLKWERSILAKSSSAGDALCDLTVSSNMGVPNHAFELEIPAIELPPPPPSLSTNHLVKEHLEDMSGSVKEAVAVAPEESTVLKCRSGRSSYSLRALKSVPFYCENGFSGISRAHDRSKSKHKKFGTKDVVMEANNNYYNNTNNNELLLYQTEEEHSYINQLPNEILCLILSYVPHLELLRSCAKVCHRWFNLVKCPFLWQSLTFRREDVPIDVVVGLIRFSPLLKSITIKDRSDVELILPVLHQQCKRLESVNLIRCRPSDGSQKNLRAKSLYPFLRKGQLRSLNLKGTDYKSRKFYQMLGTMPNLRKLDISCSKSVSPQILTAIAKHTSIKVFKNKWHSHSIYHGPKSMTIQLPGKIDDWASAYKLLLQNAGQNLSTLEFFAAGINDGALASLACCRKLKKLSVYNCNLFGGESMAAVGTLTQLHELLIHNAKLSTDDVVSAFQKDNLSALKCLHLNDSVLPSNGNASADNCLKIVATKCQQLQHLSFTKCPDLTDASVQSVLANCPQLLSLDLNGGLGIAGQSFLEIPTTSPHLKLLIVEENCSEEKSRIVKNLVENHGMSVKTVSTWKHRTKSYYL